MSTEERMTIIISDPRLDRMLTPLVLAMNAASAGIEVDILFTNWAVTALKRGEVEKLKISAEYAGAEAWLRERVEKAGFTLDLREIIRQMKTTGKINLYACALAAKIWDVSRESLIPEAELMGPATFLLEHVSRAKINLTF